MEATHYKRIQATIAAIKADPLGWAMKKDEQELLAIWGDSGIRHAKRKSDDELQADAKAQLEKSEAMIAGVVPDAPLNDARLLAANERTRRAVAGLES